MGAGADRGQRPGIALALFAKEGNKTMTEENTRILKLFYAIIGSSGFVKAGELAGLLQTARER